MPLRARVRLLLIAFGVVGAILAVIAVAPRMGGSLPQSSPSRTTGAVTLSYILLNEWVDQPGRVLAFDTRSRMEGWSFATAHDPAFALSPNGDRLYVASGQDTGGRFSVIDTATGETVDEERLPVRWLNTMPGYFPSMRVSPDGRSVYVLAFDSVGPGRDAYYARVYDSTTGRFRDEPLGIPCEAPLMLPTLDVLYAACPHSGLLLSAPVTADGQIGLLATMQVSETGIKGLVQVPGSSDLLALTAAGRLVRIAEAGAVHLFQVPGAGTDFVYDAFAISPDGATIYVGRPAASSGRIGSIEAYDLDTGALRAEIQLPVEAWTFAVEPQGRGIYVAAHEAGRLLTLDPSTLKVVDDFALPGNPTMIIP